MRNLILTTALLLIFSSCGDKKPPSETLAMVAPVVKADDEVMAKKDIVIDGGNQKEYAPPEPNQNGKLVADTTKKIIKDGSISFETNNINATRQRILHALKRAGGYVVEDNESVNSEENHKEYTLKILVPAKNFDLVLDTVSSAADKIDSKNISITDVTTRFIDITTRLNNKKLLENRYLELLKKGSKISDLLEIENKLTEIRSDIESTQGQLNYLNKQVAYSSLEITFYTQQIAQADKGIGPAYQFKQAINGGWTLLQNLFFGIISLWPVILAVILIYIPLKRWRRRRKLAAAGDK